MVEQEEEEEVAKHLPSLIKKSFYNYITMETGKVKFYNFTKGFGFIEPADGGNDVFVHQTGLTEDIRQDDKVEYDTERGQRGMNAVRVRLAR